jgi:phosphate transport system substrate-binding protein
MRLLLLVLFSLVVGCKGADAGPPTARIKGEGATFPAPLYTKWILEYRSVESRVQLEYVSSGSSAGITSLSEHTADFGATDAPLTNEQLDSVGRVIHVPLTLGAVALVVNMPDGPDELRLTPEAIAGIFMGDIKVWNDPKIASDNPGASLPAKTIRLVVRSDGSGTTKVLTEYLSQKVPAFKDKIGSKNRPTWPTGMGVTKNEGVANVVQSTENTIGYVELNYARGAKLKTVAIKNKAGRFVQPTLDSMTAAASSTAAALPEDLRAWIVDADGADSYPISSYSFAIVREEVDDPKKGETMARFFWWAIHDGQRFAPFLHYGTLPPEIVARAEARLRLMKSKGQPLLK